MRGTSSLACKPVSFSRRTLFHGVINPLNAELNPICHLLALLGAHHIHHVSKIRVKQVSKVGRDPSR